MSLCLMHEGLNKTATKLVNTVMNIETTAAEVQTSIVSRQPKLSSVLL